MAKMVHYVPLVKFPAVACMIRFVSNKLARMK
jgi:hypothetical protein